MLYKNLLFLPFVYLLLAGGKIECGCRQAPMEDTLYKKNNRVDNLQHNRVEGDTPNLRISSSRALGSLSCMSGTKTDFLLQFKGFIDNIKPQSEGQIAFIRSVDDAPLSMESSIVKRAMHLKNDLEKLLWQDGDGFIYWNKVNKIGKGPKEWIIQVGEECYKKLTSKKHAIYMLYVPSGASLEEYSISTAPCQMDIRGKGSLLPSYQNIGLEAMDPIEQQTNNGTGWFLKAKLNNDYSKDAKIGFLLVKEGVSSYKLVQQVIADGWPTETLSFNDEMIIVPGRLRNMDPPIIAKLLNSQAPIQGGKFELFCYWIQGEHYYFSQAENSLDKANIPPSITFTADSHGLSVSDLKLCIEQISDQVQNVKLSDYRIEYLVNDQVKELPDNFKVALAIFSEDSVWRTAQLESSLEKSLTANGSTMVTDDGTICLVTDSSKPLPEAAIDFLSRAKDEKHEYMVCLFSDHKLISCTQRAALSVEVEQVQPKEEPKSDELKITLDDKEASITVYKPTWSHR